MILLHADMTHEAVTIRATATTRAGHDDVLVDGAPFVVDSLKSGWCLDGRCVQCRYASCGCECHEMALRLVAQTFDTGAKSTRMAGRIKSAPAGAQTPAIRGLTTEKGWLE